MYVKNKVNDSHTEHTGSETEQQYGFHGEKHTDHFKPVALLLEWSLPGPFRGSVMEMFSWFVLTHFSLDREDRSHSHRSSSKSQRLNPSGDHTMNSFTDSEGKFDKICSSGVSFSDDWPLVIVCMMTSLWEAKVAAVAERQFTSHLRLTLNIGFF